MKSYTEQEVKAIALRGKSHPESLSLDEIRILALYLQVERESKRK